MTHVTSTRLRSNLGKYLALAQTEDIHITRNGVVFAVLSAPKEKHSLVDSFVGIIPNDGYTVQQSRKERRADAENRD